jgi:DNA-binding NarL/FixJ family response regulator
MIRISIFEDNAELREVLAGFLSWDEELKVTGLFSNCIQIEENILFWKPDVVLMDIDMPGINGIEGLKKIKAVFPSAQVMMLTVFEDEQKVFASLQAGASGYLLKKTPPAQILEAVKELSRGGSPMSGTIARKVLESFHGNAPSQESMTLTQREEEVLSLLIKGNSYKMIAAHFAISPNTVRNHIHRVYEKLHVNSATEAAYKLSRKN